MFYSKYTMLGFSKRTSKFDPRSIVGCSLWLDGADSNSMILSGSTITAWNDKSGNSQSFTVTGSPTLATNSQNGNSSVAFNGTSYFYNTTLSTPIATHTTFLVAKITGSSYYGIVSFASGAVSAYASSAAFRYAGQGSVALSNDMLDVYANNAGYQILLSVVTSNAFLMTEQTTAGSPYPTGAMYYNGSLVTPYATTQFNYTPGTAAGIAVGTYWYSSTSNSTFVGNICELLVFSNTLSATQRQSIEGYLAWKWGLQVQVPAPVSTPLSISGCALWLDATDVNATGTNPAYGNITSWKDKVSGLVLTSSNANTLLSNSVNGLPGVRFPLTQTNGYGFQGTITNPSSTYPVYVFSVVNPTYTSGQNCLIGYTSNGLNVFLYNGYYQQYNDTGYINTSGTLSVTSGPQMLTAVYNSTSSALYKNGVLIASGNTGTGTQYGGTLDIGGYPVVNNSTWQGDINELILYTSALSSTQRQSVENYLMGKWGIKPSLPAIHPFYSLPAFSRRFSPIDIPGCALWLDAADLSTITYSGSSVTSIKEKAQGITLTTQGTSSFLTTPAASIGSLQSLLFDNSSAMNVYLSGTFQSLLTGCVFIVWKSLPQSNVSWYPIFTWNSGGQYPAYGYLGGTTNLTVGPYTAYNSPNGTPTLVTTSNTNYLTFYSWSGTTPTVGQYGATPTTGTQATFTSSTTTFWIGADGGGAAGRTNMNLGELIMFNTVLGTTQRQQVEGYLAAKWGLLNNFSSNASSPLNISGCTVWLDAADTSTLTLSTNNVSQWNDKSGNGNNATQATSSSQPTSGGSQNGLNTLLFTGKTMVLPTISLSTQTVFCVYLNTTFTPYGEPVALGPFAFFYAAPSSNVGIGRTGATDEVLANWSTNGLTTSKYTVYGGTVSVSGSTTSVLYFNGNQVASNTVTSSGGGVYYRVGHYLGQTTGYIAEVIIYNTALSTAQRQSVENYLMSKWGISNVTTHPFKSIPPSTSQPPQFQEVTPGNWTYDWQPYLQRLTAANSSGVTVTTSNITGGATYTNYGWIGGGVLAPNGNIYFTPYTATNILVINPTTGVTSNLTGGASYTSNGWNGGVLAPNGNIYFTPLNATNVLVLNPTTGVTSNLTGGATYAANGWNGGVVAPNGNIYFAPFAVSNIFVINPTTGVTSNLAGPTGGGYTGGVLAPNGNIYFGPTWATNILVLNPTTGATSTLTGGATYVSGGWNGGVLAPNGNIYYAPSLASNILVFNPTTGVTSNLTGGATYTANGWSGGVLGPNGNIYFAPYYATNILVLNPTTGVTSNLTGSATYTTNGGWSGGILALNGNIYFAPLQAGTTLTVKFSGLSQLPSSNYCLSAWTNKF